MTRNATCRLEEEKKQKNERKKPKSQNCDFSPSPGGATCASIVTKFGVFVDFTEVVSPTKCGEKCLKGFPGQQVEKSIFPFRKPMAYITLPCATTLAGNE